MTVGAQSFDPARLKRLRELDRWLLAEIDAAGAVPRDHLGELVVQTRLAALRMSEATLDEWFCDAVRRRLVARLDDPAAEGAYALTERGSAHMRRRVLADDLDLGSFGSVIESFGRAALVSGVVPALVAAAVAGRAVVPYLIVGLVLVVGLAAANNLSSAALGRLFWRLDMARLRKVIAELERREAPR